MGELDKSLVSGGNVGRSTTKPVARMRVSYMRGTGGGAGKVHEMLSAAKAQGLTFEGTYEYSNVLGFRRLLLLNFIFAGDKGLCDAVEEGLRDITRAHNLDFT